MILVEILPLEKPPIHNEAKKRRLSQFHTCISSLITIFSHIISYRYADANKS